MELTVSERVSARNIGAWPTAGVADSDGIYTIPQNMAKLPTGIEETPIQVSQ